MAQLGLPLGNKLSKSSSATQRNNLELRIFDTWGSQIYFESGNDISGWNGILKNKLAENGNYYYTFKAKTSYGEVIIQDGPFTLIR